MMKTLLSSPPNLAWYTFRTISGLVLVVLTAFSPVAAQKPMTAPRRQAARVSQNVLLTIIRAEDERRWDNALIELLQDKDPAVRRRAALAASRIGDELAVPALTSLLQEDKDDNVRAMAAFALGEIESASATEAMTAQLSKQEDAMVRGRIVEALGKIAAALPLANEEQKKLLGKTILGVLSFEAQRRSRPDSEVILFALTATLRARPEGAGKVIAEFLSYSDPRVRSDAGNSLARLRAKDGNEELRKLLTSDPDANVRANAARVLGATEDKAAFEGLLDRALKDPDSRVRVSAIRSLATLKDPRAAEPMLETGIRLLESSERKPSGKISLLARQNELLEIASTVGRLMQGTEDKKAITWLKSLRAAMKVTAPESEIALARLAPKYYPHLTNGESVRPRLNNKPFDISSGDFERTDRPILVSPDWRQAAAVAQGLAEIANSDIKPDWIAYGLRNIARDQLLPALACQIRPLSNARGRKSGLILPKGESDCLVANALSVPDMLRAIAALKPTELAAILRNHLKESDVTIRTTAAELLAELPLDSTNTEALAAALKVALRDKDSNDAALAILDALAKQKNRNANEAIKTALESSDSLVWRKAVNSLKANGAGDFKARLGPVQTRNSTADYARALSRIGKQVLAVVSTSKGSFTIEFLPDEAPLTVDNFVQLAKRGYFNGIVFHRVVPNFVVQGGDPRGDGNGGPGYQIRCEINEVPYDRAAVGMALSGKDTGGSQWFVTHAPQPHLDGGYTVFGRVIAGMNVVDDIARGDLIRSIKVKESSRRGASRGR